MGQKGHIRDFFEKRPPQNFTLLPFPPPCSIPFLSIFYENKALHNFRKREQRSIVERNIALEYALDTPLIYYFVQSTRGSYTEECQKQL